MLEVIAISDVEPTPGAVSQVEPSNVVHKVAITCRDRAPPTAGS